MLYVLPTRLQRENALIIIKCDRQDKSSVYFQMANVTFSGYVLQSIFVLEHERFSCSESAKMQKIRRPWRADY